MISKNSTWKSGLYLATINALKHSTNLSRIQKELSISKQKLNYYLRRLKKDGFIIQKGRGWYEVVKEVKLSTKYGIFLKPDTIRGHAYIYTIDFPQEIKDWDKRIEILKKRGINFKLVGAKETTPRIKVLGRKVWLCNNHLRIFDKKDASYYGTNAKESRYYAFQEIKLVVNALNRKLGVFLKPSKIHFRKEHYALIKNDLAIEENRKGNIIRISDDAGEWLLIDDSLEQGGELENVGKKAFQINMPMQKWWNDHKEHDFKVTPSFLMEILKENISQIQQVTNNQEIFDKNISLHQDVLREMSETLKKIQESLK